MNNLQYFSFTKFIDKNTLDDDTRWFLELEETLELNPIREYKNVVIDEPFIHHINLDLDDRVSTLIKMFEENQKIKRYNNAYLRKLAHRLIVLSWDNDRPDLEEKLLLFILHKTF